MYDNDRSFRIFSRELQNEFEIYVGAQAKLNIYNLTAEVRQYTSVNDPAKDELSVCIVRSDDKEKTDTM